MQNTYAHLVDHLRAEAKQAKEHAVAGCPGDPEFGSLAACADWYNGSGKCGAEFQE